MICETVRAFSKRDEGRDTKSTSFKALLIADVSPCPCLGLTVSDKKTKGGIATSLCQSRHRAENKVEARKKK